VLFDACQAVHTTKSATLWIMDGPILCRICIVYGTPPPYDDVPVVSCLFLHLFISLFSLLRAREDRCMERSSLRWSRERKRGARGLGCHNARLRRSSYRQRSVRARQKLSLALSRRTWASPRRRPSRGGRRERISGFHLWV
jgi:hypothetical protein